MPLRKCIWIIQMCEEEVVVSHFRFLFFLIAEMLINLNYGYDCVFSICLLKSFFYHRRILNQMVVVFSMFLCTESQIFQLQILASLSVDN